MGRTTPTPQSGPGSGPRKTSGSGSSGANAASQGASSGPGSAGFAGSASSAAGTGSMSATSAAAGPIPDGAVLPVAAAAAGAGATIEARMSSDRRRRRDRRGRGLRGHLLPRDVPAWRSRADRFDDLVLDAVEHLETTWGSQLEGVEFAVEDVPPSDPSPWEHGEVPLGRFFPSEGELPPRIVVYRRPVETRAGEPREVGLLAQNVIVEQVAHLLNLPPDQVDPRYNRDD